MGRALRAVGYEVVFLGAEKSGRLQDIKADNRFNYEGFPYLPAGDVGDSKLRRALRLWRTHFSGLGVMTRLKELWTEDSVAIVAYQASSPLIAQLKRFCRRHNAVLLADTVEWYDRRHVRGGRFGLLALDSELRMRYMHAQVDGIVAISSYLEKYYRRIGMTTLCVPALIDVLECRQRVDVCQEACGSMQLAFVGNAGKKDYLANAIRGLALLGEESRKWKLRIVGPSRLEVMRSLDGDAGLLDRMSEALEFVGSVAHGEALELLGQADFSVLLRPDLRYAHAGFPTKLVESLAMGVPVICNLTGDIGLYVRDGHEGLVVPDCSPVAFALGLRRAMGLSCEQRMAMRAEARKTAEEQFDYRRWIQPLGAFMSRVIESRRGKAASW